VLIRQGQQILKIHIYAVIFKESFRNALVWREAKYGISQHRFSVVDSVRKSKYSFGKIFCTLELQTLD
jgi:hypothetical protein